VGILITSIILAITIILYYFRGRLNYKEGANHLKSLAILWIIQNAFMIFSTAYRTNMYVEEFGLSYKKIGVFVYLLLTFIGLITTFYKLRKSKSNWYLVRTNSWIWYALLILSPLLNWDVIITNFNLSKSFHEKKALEKYYLADLSFKNLPQLIQLPDSIKSKDDFAIRDYYYKLKGTYFPNFKIGLDRKLYNFLDDWQDADLRSWCFEKSRVFNEIVQLSPQIKDLDLSQGARVISVSCLNILDNLKVLNLDNSGFRKLDELGVFKELESLSLRSNQIDSLEKLPALNLRHLYLGGNPVKDIGAINRLEKLETLLLNGSSLNETPALSLNNLHTLDISNNSITDFSPLKNYPALKHLNLRNTFKGKTPAIPKISTLESLDLSENDLSKLEPASFIKNWTSSKNLKSLSLGENGFARPYFLTNFYSRQNESDPVEPVFPSLELLDLSNNLLVSSAMLDKLSNLKELDLGGNKLKHVENLFSMSTLLKLDLSSNPIESLKGIEQLKHVEELNISNCHVPSGIKEISFLTRLKKLDISGNYCKDLGFIIPLRQLKSLDLSNTDLNTLKGIESLESLETVYLQNLNISDFSPLYALRNLRLLHVSNISNEKLLKLKKSLPLCEVHEDYRQAD
jgi:Leucine-rich repeat (LRR) protein